MTVRFASAEDSPLLAALLQAYVRESFNGQWAGSSEALSNATERNLVRWAASGIENRS
ncbi:MAG TPA: hypothetical protein VHV51_18525 [Polyangiaceae bacterium]|jgi:hypothetical protein|nr:hypothetical protein [Polyangiaceae bacterium]